MVIYGIVKRCVEKEKEKEEELAGVKAMATANTLTSASNSIKIVDINREDEPNMYEKKEVSIRL